MRRTIAATAFWAALAVPGQARADRAFSLYQAMEIVTGTDMRERPRGFALCLEDVLIKVSGDPRLRADPRIDDAKRHADRYVTDFTYLDPIAGTRPKDDQGTYDRSENLTVMFDPAKIDALLSSLGEKPWRGARPVLLPLLTVHARKAPDYRLTADEPLAAEQRAAFQRIADESGLPLKFPTPANGGRAKAMIIVLGSLVWTEAAGGWVGTWHARWHGKDHHWTIAGVGYDQAFANLVMGTLLLASGRGEPEQMP